MPDRKKPSDFHERQMVAYIPAHAHGDILHPDVQFGAVSSTNDKFVFVKYEKQLVKFGWDGTTSEATDPNDLVALLEDSFAARQVSLKDFFPNMEVFTIEVGDRVLCDWCDLEWTDRPESGGITFGSKACCPVCAPKIEADAVREGETHFIRARCPAELSFANWVRTVLRATP